MQHAPLMRFARLEFARKQGHTDWQRTLLSVQCVRAFDKILSGLSVGQSKQERHEAKDCYGEWQEKLVTRMKNQV
jgi:hypothetical protein